MRIGITGATGFLGRYLVEHLAGLGHECRCWFRPKGDRSGFDPAASIAWVPGSLGDRAACRDLARGCDAIVHAALARPGAGFRGAEGDLHEFVERNVLGTIDMIEEARAEGVGRFVFISTCAVHETILDDRPLDETHPLWPHSHYGAHKAAIEAFVHSYGRGVGYPICALRPTGIYGLARPAAESKWFDLVAAVARGEEVEVQGGGKEVHALDVARPVAILLGTDADQIAGQAFACYDRYVSRREVAEIAQALSGTAGAIRGDRPSPKNQIDTRKLSALGMTFGGPPLLERTISELLREVR